MNKLYVITGGFILLVVTYFIFGVASNIISQIYTAFQPMLQAYSSSYPWLTEWNKYYQLTWQWLPILTVAAIVMWMFLKGNELEVDDELREAP